MKTDPLTRYLGCALLSCGLVDCAASSAAEPSSIKFAAFGDIGNTARSAAVAKLTRSQSAQFIIMLGDLCYGRKPIAEQIGANYAAEHAAGKLYPSLGNHEFKDTCGGGNSASAYRAYFTLPNNERYYDFVKGPVHFFALNSFNEPDGLKPNSKQGRWLRGRLAESTSPWQVVFFHHPPFSSGVHQSSTYMRWPFESWGVDAVLNGHDHDYERILKDADNNGVRLPYFVSGLGGKSRRSFKKVVSGSEERYSAAEGALFVTATPTSMQFEFRNTGGRLIDSYTTTKAVTRSKTKDRLGGST